MNRYSLYALTAAILLVTALVSRTSAIVLLLIPVVLRFLNRGRNEAPEIAIKRSISEKRVKNGDETEVILSISVKGAGMGRIRIDEQLSSKLELTEGKAGLFDILTNDYKGELVYKVRCPRGLHKFDNIIITLWDHLGLNKREYHIESDDEIVALHDPVQITSFPIDVRKTLVYAGLNPSGQGGDGVYFHDVREYRTGDSLRHIHWSAVAKRPDMLITKEFEQERVSDIGIILDGRSESYRQYGNTQQLEKGIEAVSALSEALLRLQNRVGLMIYGDSLNWTMPGYGKMQVERIRRALASAEAGSHQVFKSLDNLPTNLFPEKSQLIFISPLQGDDGDMLKKLRGRGYQIMVIAMDGLDDSAGEIDQLAIDLSRLERLRFTRDLERFGIVVLTWNLNDSVEELIQVNRGKLQMALRGSR